MAELPDTDPSRCCLAVFAAAHIVFAERPEDCAPEDREMPGNTNSPCKWDYRFDEITSVRYEVVENIEGNTCHEVLVFEPSNSTRDLPEQVYIQVWMGQKNHQGEIGSTWGSIGGEVVGKDCRFGNNHTGTSLWSSRRSSAARSILFS